MILSFARFVARTTRPAVAAAALACGDGGPSGPDGTRWVALSASEAHACALASGGAAYCWGRGGAGQLGVPDPNDMCTPGTIAFPCNTIPVAVSGGLRFTSITTGNEFSCGLTGAGRAYCWGANSYGQLGNNATTGSAAPVPVAGGLVFVSIDAGYRHACGRTIGNSVYCWGSNAFGQLGTTSTPPCVPPNNSSQCSTVPVPVSGGLTFSALSVGFWTSCGLTVAGSAACWGRNIYGTFGNGTTQSSITPTPVSNGIVFSSITAGAAHTCALAIGGATYCWGGNIAGQLGDGTFTTRLTPTAVSTSGERFSALIAGEGNTILSHSCAVTSAGGTFCWGSNAHGQLGVSGLPECNAISLTFGCSATPVRVEGDLPAAAALALGNAFTCALTTTRAIYCWGLNTSGQLARGTKANSSLPARVADPRSPNRS